MGVEKRLWIRWCCVSLLHLFLIAGCGSAQGLESGKASAEEPSTKKTAWWRRVISPFRPGPSPYFSKQPCGLGFVGCFSAGDLDAREGKQRLSPKGHSSKVGLPPFATKGEATESQKTRLWTRTGRGGPFAHQWLEMETSIGLVTLGFGPATIPFIDSGQISLQDSHGNIERISGTHPLPVLTLPPVNYSYARQPGEGKIIGKPLEITLSQAEDIIRRNRSRKYIFPYIPIFNDCRTFVCKTREQAKGRSGILCHLLLKGYW